MQTPQGGSGLHWYQDPHQPINLPIFSQPFDTMGSPTSHMFPGHTTYQTGLVSSTGMMSFNPGAHTMPPYPINSYGHGFLPGTADGPDAQYSFDIDGIPPFVDLTRLGGASGRGIIRIKNIPYNLTLPEVTQFLQKYLLPQGGARHSKAFPVHIIMERPTAKTMDCFVELDNEEVVDIAMGRYEALLQSGRPPKMGTRHVLIEASSQGELMREVFPRAKSIYWNTKTGIPTVFPNTDPFSSGFNGFLTGEEMAGMVRHAEFPNRSPFAQRCLQRTYECMITTLVKFPWSSGDYHIEARDKLFDTFRSQLRTLLAKVAPEHGHHGRNTREVGLDTRLLSDLVTAGLVCPGFSERQKAMISDVAGGFSHVSLSRFSNVWPFETLCKPHNVGDQDIGAWLDLLSSGADAYFKTGETLQIEPYVYLDRDGGGHVVIRMTDAGYKLKFAKVIVLETMIMKMVIDKGWERWFASRGMPYEPEEIDDSIDIEERMTRLALQGPGHTTSVCENNITSPLSDDQGSQAMQQLLLNSEDDVSEADDGDETPRQAHAMPVVNSLLDPFNSRATTATLGSKLAGLPSAFGGGHHSQQVSSLARHLNPESASFAPGGGVQCRMFGDGAAFQNTSGRAKNFSPTASGNRAIKIRSPAGAEISGVDADTVTRSDISAIYIDQYLHSPSEEYSQFLSYSRRSSLASTSDGGSQSSGVSSRSKKSSPMKNRTPPEPIGTPSRQQQARSSLNIDLTIKEESEDTEQLAMGGFQR